MALDLARRLFVKEYLVDLVASKAAERAGFVKAMAPRLMKEPEVAAAIERGVASREKALSITADKVLGEIGALAFSDLRRIFREDGGLLLPDEWPDDVAPAIASVKVDEIFEGKGPERKQIGFSKEVKLWDKPAALTMLGKHLKLWVEQVEVRVDSMTDEERLLRAEAIIAAGLARAREKALLVEATSAEPAEDDMEDLIGG